MNENVSENRTSKIVGLLFVVAIHLGLLYLAMSYKLIPPPQEALTLMVNLINPPKKVEPPPPPEPPKPPPKEVKLVKEKPIERPKPAPVLVAETPVVTATEPVVEKQPEPEPIKEAPPPEPVAEAPAKPAGPVTLSELSLACPQRSEPNYPAVSRRKGEHGQVRLRVELDESGHVVSVKVAQSSGFKRLDDAGVAAVKSWQCNPAMRDGKAVRAVALQPFDFILEGE
ncbi:MAG: energy transducer TonB [Methylotenera sp.]|nr:energy transducer TonB [Methylotenera sp.]